MAANATESSGKHTWWSVPTLALWCVFMMIGLAPDLFYAHLREFGRVLTQHALVNNVYVVTVGFAGYLAWFVRARCLEAGLSAKESGGRALQVLMLGLLAFLPIEYTLKLLVASQFILVPELRYFVFLVAPGKLLAWLYLNSLFFMYYALNRTDAFGRIPSIFPSSYTRQRDAGENEAEVRALLRSQETTKDSSGG